MMWFTFRSSLAAYSVIQAKITKKGKQDCYNVGLTAKYSVCQAKMRTIKTGCWLIEDARLLTKSKQRNRLMIKAIFFFSLHIFPF